ncbi:MAG: SH3 domain-containing protein, partial [Gammaproteobacteria bacterium]
MTKLLITLAMLLATGVAGASERATVTRPAELQDAPYADASRTASVAGNQSVQILLRQGGWYKVRTDAGAEGWLRMFSVRLGSSPTRTETASRDDDSGGWFSFFRRSRTGSRQSTATTGIRGLDSGDIKTAQPDPAAV